MADAKSANAGGEKRTLVEDGTLFKGALSSTCPIIVNGKIEGQLSAPSLTISSSGAVHGTVKVGELRSEGELSGEFDADVVQLSGTVKDNTVIRAKSLEVKLAPQNGKMQVIFGECALDIGEAPSRTATVASERTAAPSALPPAPGAALTAAIASSPSTPPPSLASPAASSVVTASASASASALASPPAAAPAPRRADSLPPIPSGDEPVRASTRPAGTDGQSG